MATMLIRNLPARVDEARLKEIFGEDRVKAVEYKEDPNPNTSDRQALVTLDMPAFEAEKVASKYNGMIVEGKPLRISVMHFMG